jgi:hypothetical protein
MSWTSPPRAYPDREQRPYPDREQRPYPDREQQGFPGGPSRRKPRRSRGDRLLEVLRTPVVQRTALIASVVIELALLLIALVPQNVWVSLGRPNGPIPTALEPVVAGLFYFLPAATGALCRRWMPAVVLATLPAALDLGVYAAAGAIHNGPFYLATDTHAAAAVGTIELFAVLGALGWFARTTLLDALKQRKGRR